MEDKSCNILEMQPVPILNYMYRMPVGAIKLFLEKLPTEYRRFKQTLKGK